ncbi:Periplasmic serine endoprotease DegP [Candidatus Entotheonellaceae bacterium PAL068K]
MMRSIRHQQRGIGILAVCWLLWGSHTGLLAAETSRLWQEQAEAPTAAIHQGLQLFVDLADKLSPAVVNISIVQKSAQGKERSLRFRRPFRERNPFGADPFREFFERFFGDVPPQARQSLGSGFIINPNGLILTNHHVIEEADKIKVILHDEREFEAQVVGHDPKTDLALIQIRPQTVLPTVPLGDSDRLRIGEWVMAIGNPYGLSHTVTAGIISAKGRVIGAGKYDDFIQTDASINPGNSGGPLFNTHGEVVGINTAMISSGIGIGFAIPVNLAKDMLPQLHEKGRVTRGWLGVIIQKITPELARSFALPQAQGALVAEVIEGSPAARAGLHRGDMITMFNDTQIHDMRELPRIVAITPVGKRVKIDILRQGQRKTLTVTIAELRDPGTDPAHSAMQLGMQVQELTPELAQNMGLPTTEGVFVTAVESDSPAAEAGVRRGDVVFEVNRQPVRNLHDYTAVMRRQDDATILLLIARGENTLYVALKQP